MNEDYTLYQKWIELLDWILDRLEKFPKDVRFTFGQRMSNLSLDILELIIESIYTRNRKPLLTRINLHLEKLRVFFRLSHTRRYISTGQYEHVALRFDEFGRMVGGWIRSDREGGEGGSYA